MGRQLSGIPAGSWWRWSALVNRLISVGRLTDGRETAAATIYPTGRPVGANWRWMDGSRRYDRSLSDIGRPDDFSWLRQPRRLFSPISFLRAIFTFVDAPPGRYVVERARSRTTAASLAINETPVCMEQPAAELRLLRSITTSRRRLKTFPWTLHPDTGKQTGGCFVMRPRSPSRGDNVYDSVIV